jgi:hypothetical protein
MANKKRPVPALKNQQFSQKKTSDESLPPKPQVISTPPSIAKVKVGAAPTTEFAFGKWNYILMIAGIVLMAIGFILMIGGGSKDPKVFNPAIFDAQRLTVAPVLILLGFAVEIVAILKKPKI